MYGPPKDEEGECNARFYIGDDYGDNVCTIRCKLEPGHEGLHTEKFDRDGHPVIITWEQDESYLCETHGRVQKDENDESGLSCTQCSNNWYSEQDKEN